MNKTETKKRNSSHNSDTEFIWSCRSYFLRFFGFSLEWNIQQWFDTDAMKFVFDIRRLDMMNFNALHIFRYPVKYINIYWTYWPKMWCRHSWLAVWLKQFLMTLVSLLTFRLAPPERWRGFLSEIPKGLIQTKSSVCHYMWNISLHSMCSWSFMLLVWSAKLFWLHILPPQVALFFFFRFRLVTLCSAPPQASHAE